MLHRMMSLLMALYTLKFVLVGKQWLLLGYDSCTDGVNELLQLGQQRIALASTKTIQCALTGMVPEQDHLIEVFGDEVLIFSTTQRTSVADERPEAGDTSPVLFALGAIVLSLIALLSFAKWNDTKLGRTNPNSLISMSHLRSWPWRF